MASFYGFSMRHTKQPPKSSKPISAEDPGLCMLPSLATAEQVAAVLQITSRTLHNWAVAGIVPVAIRRGKIVRFHPPAVAAALGLNLPEFGRIKGEDISPQQPDNHEPKQIATKNNHKKSQ